ncbi:MAG: GxxExxY protein [Myxococcales bacterium]|nr:GxxExxY protein [Myxococcales bacterium]
MDENEIATVVVDAALKVHRILGPGLLESVYETVLAHEVRGRGLRVRTQVPIPIEYEGVRIERGFRADLIVEERLLVELKCAERASAAHKKQTLTYLRLAGLKLGLLLNFSHELMKQGITRVVNGL